LNRVVDDEARYGRSVQLDRNLFPLKFTNLSKLAKVPDVGCLMVSPRRAALIAINASLVSRDFPTIPKPNRAPNWLRTVPVTLRSVRFGTSRRLIESNSRSSRRNACRAFRSEAPTNSSSRTTALNHNGRVFVSPLERRDANARQTHYRDGAPVNGSVEDNGRQAASLPGEIPEDVLDNDPGVDEAFRG
jgi:hypothetical protein